MLEATSEYPINLFAYHMSVCFVERGIAILIQQDANISGWGF